MSVNIMKLLLFNLNANIRIIGKLWITWRYDYEYKLTSKFQNTRITE